MEWPEINIDMIDFATTSTELRIWKRVRGSRRTCGKNDADDNFLYLLIILQVYGSVFSLTETRFFKLSLPFPPLPFLPELGGEGTDQ